MNAITNLAKLFKFNGGVHPPENKLIMSQWWRSSRARLWHWAEFYQSEATAKVPTEPSLFARIGRGLKSLVTRSPSKQH